jgi:hypothetical protein
VSIALIGLLALFGLVVGAVGRLLVPGPDPMSLLETLAVGLGAGAISGIVNVVLGGPGYLPFPLTLLIAAAIVWDVRRRRRRAEQPPV